MKTKVADASAIDEAKGLCVKAGGQNLVLFRKGEQVFALQNKCPHFGLPLGRGKVENGQIVCPFHGSRFDIETGANKDWVNAFFGLKLPGFMRSVISMGKKPEAVKTYDVSVEAGEVFVEV